jgi:hypothetical protein
LDAHVHTNPYGDGPIPPDTGQYKTDYLTYLLEDVGLDIVRVYGNATTDIGAYAAVGLPKSETYNDYLQHLNTVVASTPGAGCTPRWLCNHHAVSPSSGGNAASRMFQWPRHPLHPGKRFLFLVRMNATPSSRQTWRSRWKSTPLT